MPATLRHAIFVVVTLAAAVLLWGCDSAGPTAQEEPEETENEPEPALTLLGETQREGIRLDWEGENLGDKDYFRVYRGTEAGFDTSGAAIADTSVTALVDVGHTPSAEYYYRVGAFDEKDGPIVLSDEERTLSPPGEPTGLEGEGQFYRSALWWEPAEGAEGGYRVYRSRAPFSSPSEAEQIGSAQEASFTDSTALDGINYTYRVATVGPEGDEGTLSPRAQVTPSFEGNPLEGKRLVESVCADCHAATDGWDLAAFEFPDTTIHRRGTDHVTEQEVQDIIRFIESKDEGLPEGVGNEESDLPPFQPGGEVLGSDKEFAMELFGQDQWPEDLTEEELLSVNPRELPVPLEMPRWSVEKNDQDWIAERPLPEHVRTESGFQSALSQYRETRSEEDLVRTVRAFHSARTAGERHPGEHGNTGREAFFESFEMYRWLSTLIGTHHLRSGNADLPGQVDGRPVEGRHFGMTNPWWRVGDIMRRFDAFRDDEPDEALKIAARWFYLAWSFRQDVPGHEQKYMVDALTQGFGLGRVAAFGLAYGAVASRPNNHHIYTDLYAVERAQKSWQGNLTIFLLEHLIGRWKSGDTIEHDRQRGYARDAVQEGIDRVLNSNSQIPDSKREKIRDLQDELLSLMSEEQG